MTKSDKPREHRQQLLSLHLLRERVALAELQQQQRTVELFEEKRNEIRATVSAFESLLGQQINQRLEASVFTPARLQEDQNSRDIIRRDLVKEELYLETAEDDLSTAITELRKRYTHWQQHRVRAEALCKLDDQQKRSSALREQKRLQAELDEKQAGGYASH